MDKDRRSSKRLCQRPRKDARCGSGSTQPEGFAIFWSRHREEIFHACLRWTGGHRADAEDALSTAALVAWQEFQRVRKPRPWLLRVARNACIDQHRARRHWTSSLDCQRSAEREQIRNELWSSAPLSPEAEFGCREFEGYVLNCIQCLPERLRVPLMMRIEQLSYLAIAHKLHLTPANVRKRIQHARQILRVRIFQYETRRHPPLVFAAQAVRSRDANPDRLSQS